MAFRKTFLIIIGSVLSSIGTLHAQENTSTVDICKIEFAAAIELMSSAKVVPAPKPPVAMAVYYNPDYLYGMLVQDDGKERSWLIWHHRKMLLQIDDKLGLPLNYGKQLKTNVYLPGEAKADTATYSTVADWDNESEYDSPGKGTLTLTEDTTTIQGYMCRKAIIQYHADSLGKAGPVRSVEIWYCPDLPAFVIPPYSFLQKIPGAALAIMTESTYGKKTFLQASSITQQQEDITFFRPAEDIQIMYPPAPVKP
ncbi:hypothetical protein [Chitinophaga qingshengii]|uniref:GLPGLI family protein n=1 Tax=Chitinophaga qingshengii TaxID=1569794 RepID=A0ABR7TRR9_9BACT|nr:hypothetical protein [Chitinophaga qingshengii]MBC9932278.1 hypothetical protein [Chitinophaga qingshengii]